MRLASWQVVSKVFIASIDKCMMVFLSLNKLLKVIIKDNYIAEMRNCQAFTLSLLCVTIFLTRSISKGDM